MASNKSRRDALRGAEDQIFDLLFKTSPPEAWKGFLTTPLELAAAQGDVGLVDKLMEAGAGFGLAVHEAVKFGHVDVANKLLEGGASPREKDARGNTPLHVATEEGKLEMVQLLLPLVGADKDALGACGCTPLQLAAKYGHVAVVRALLSAGVDPHRRYGDRRRSALHRAALGGNLEVLKVLIEHGVGLDATDRHGRTALSYAARVNKAEAVDMLIEAGCNIEAKDSRGVRPLHLASSESCPEPALVLLRHGAHVNSQTSDTRSTPLHFVAMKAGTQGAAETVDVLLRSGADETIRNAEGVAAADIVGARVEEEDRVAEDFERVRRLLKNAPADRAWRRRGLFVLCRAHPDRVQPIQESNQTHSGVTSRTRRGAKLARAAATGGNDAGGGTIVIGNGGAEWAVVAASVVRLEEEGIFRTIVGYL